jgi:2-polyprenyl-3-methyl-5-hydroxy-6-metoxy-1,4-benzoquinol methylase
MNEGKQAPAEFDQFAQNYDQLHAKSLGAAGEGPEYFAVYKARCLERFGVGPTAQVLDYGCGVGNLTRHLVPRFAQVHGFDPSPACVDRAVTEVPEATFHSREDAIPSDAFDAIVVANVLHHVPPEARPALVSSLVPRLKPGGRLFVFEHNPYNPLTRRSVAICEFDIDVILLGPAEVRRLMHGASLAPIRQDYIVFFPRLLAAFRFLEPGLSWLPLGAQTLTVGTRS